MYDNDDQRQALGQPSLNIPMLKMIVVHKFFYYYFLPSKKSIFYIYVPPLFFICAICCVWSCFVQLCQYHLMFRTQKPANVWVNHCLSDLCTDCRCLISYFFSSKKEIKSAGTEKWVVCVVVCPSFTSAEHRVKHKYVFGAVIESPPFSRGKNTPEYRWAFIITFRSWAFRRSEEECWHSAHVRVRARALCR